MVNQELRRETLETANIECSKSEWKMCVLTGVAIRARSKFLLSPRHRTH